MRPRPTTNCISDLSLIVLKDCKLHSNINPHCKPFRLNNILRKIHPYHHDLGLCACELAGYIEIPHRIPPNLKLN